LLCWLMLYCVFGKTTLNRPTASMSMSSAHENVKSLVVPFVLRLESIYNNPLSFVLIYYCIISHLRINDFLSVNLLLIHLLFHLIQHQVRNIFDIIFQQIRPLSSILIAPRCVPHILIIQFTDLWIVLNEIFIGRVNSRIQVSQSIHLRVISSLFQSG
jgi:hypothetical protein